MQQGKKRQGTQTTTAPVNLPDEMLLLIFRYLPVKALMHARRVSTQWKSISEDPSLLKDGEYYSANRLHVCVLGLASSGKSTLIGKICAQYSRMHRRTVERNQKKDFVSNPWSAVVDIRREEQRYGKTLAMHHVEIKMSFSHSVTFWNVAGYRDSLEHVFRVASMSDVAFLVIPANEHVYLKENHTIFQSSKQEKQEKEKGKEKEKEKGKEKQRQQRHNDDKQYFLNDAGAPCLGILNEQLLLAKTAGVKRVLVLINWMDSHTPEEGQRVFESIRDHILSSGLLKKAGFTSDPSLIVPCSAWKNTNLFRKGFDWFDGPTVMEALYRMAMNQSNYRYPIQLQDKKAAMARVDPFTMSIQEVFKIGGVGPVICGRVISGVLDTTRPPLNSVTLQLERLSLRTFKIISIESSYVMINLARPGDYIGLNLSAFPSGSLWALQKRVDRGQIVVAPPISFTSEPSLYRYDLVNKFKVFAQVVGAHRRQIHFGAILVALIQCDRLRCKIISLQLADKDKNPISAKDQKTPKDPIPTLFARTGSFVLLELALEYAGKTEQQRVILPNERIALRDNDATLAVGVITAGSKLADLTPKALPTATTKKPFRGAEPKWF